MVDNQINKTNEAIYDMPLVSVIVATYRRDESLKKALESLISQTYKNLEIIVVDDNADNEWNKLVKGNVDCINSKTTLTIKLIVNSINKGSAETRNIGIRDSQGVYITFLDDDDIYLEGKVEHQINDMIENNSSFSLTDLFLYDDNDNLVEKRIRSYIQDKTKTSLIKYHLIYHMTGTDVMMFKKLYLLDIGLFSKINIGDEFYLMLKAIENEGKFSYLPRCDVKAYVHYSENSMSNSFEKIIGEKSLYEFKKSFFYVLNRKQQNYVKMRHFAVLAFVYLRRKNIYSFILNSVLSFLSSPFSCFKLFINKFNLVKRAEI